MLDYKKHTGFQFPYNSETASHREGGIKIQPVIPIVEIPQGGEYIALIIQGAGKFFPLPNIFH